MRRRFVTDSVSNRRYGYLIDSLSHPGFGEFRGRHIAGRNVIEASHQIECELMLEIGASIRHLGVQLRDMPLVLSRSLGLRRRFSRAPTEPGAAQLLAGRKCREVSQAKIDTGTDRAGLNIGDLDHDVQKPVAAPILRRAGSVLDHAFGKQPAEKDVEDIVDEAKCIGIALQVTALQWHPAQRYSAAIAQASASVQAARFRVLLARCVDRAGVDGKFLAAASCQNVRVKSRRPLLAPLYRVPLRVVAEVPDGVDRSALLVQQSHLTISLGSDRQGSCRSF
ncbi:hypothetical protein BLA18110_07841 [Burkholderia lata]|nr:hypothetical protein BLA18110_07841 [Burkholderia lata]